MRRRLAQFISAASLTTLCVACGASAPSSELVTARSAYEEARTGPAGQANPTGVHEAEQALAAAEAAHDADAGSDLEKHRAYIATRRAQLAVAKGNQALSKASGEEAEDKYRRVLEDKTRSLSTQRSQYADQLEDAQRELLTVRTELSATDASLGESKQALEEKERQLAERVKELEAEREAREAAEAKVAQARKDLEALAKVKDEAGRLVITLSGSVLFKTASSHLMSVAESRLSTVADALEGYGDAGIVVEGHTDSRGTTEYNKELSQKRAESVRAFLVSKGLSAERITARGAGESRPIAKNETPEGRANNRRVEIIVEHGNKASETSGGAASLSTH